MTLNLLAQNVAFQPLTLTAPAGAPFVIHLRNADPVGLSHDVDIRTNEGNSVVGEHDLIDGGAEGDLTFDPLRAGDYIFICRVHPIPAMTGTLTVR